MDGPLTPQTQPAAAKPQAVKLPRVRQDLALYPAEDDANGSPQWNLHDPLSNKYYMLDEKDVQLLPLLSNRSIPQIIKIAKTSFRSNVTEEDIMELAEFLRKSNLVEADPKQLEAYETQLDNKPKLTVHGLLRKVLFLRVPLWNPDKFLDRTLPSIRWMFSKPALYGLLIIAILGIYLFSRQVDEFFSTFLFFFSWSGVVTYILALAFVKIFHELGHAYAAKSFGCKVPTLGVSLIMGWPVLFTDTSDAWKLPDRNKRMVIGVAGVAVELVIAIISLFLWSITPEGSMKSAFFLLATTTWILSVLVNFNPLMRFDGYYLMSDFLRIPNLEARSFSMAKWWLRERLFGLNLEPPEHFRPAMIVYAYSVWVYRFFLYVGIAVLVYSFFFKAAGLIVFAIEIFAFIFVPIIKEVKVWWEMREQIKLNAFIWRRIALLVIFTGLMFLPWQTDISTAAVLQGKYSDIYLPEAGQLTIMNAVSNASVAESDLLFEIVSPELEKNLEEVTHRYTELRWSQSSLGFNAGLRSQARIVNSELLTQNQRLRSLLRLKEQLSIKAPVSGTVFDIAPDISVGDWLPQGLKIATVVDLSSLGIVAYLPEEELARVEVGMSAKFYPENQEFGVLNAVVKSIDFAGIDELDSLYPASTFGGEVAVREAGDGVLSLVKSHYKVNLEIIDSDKTFTRAVRGTAHIDGHPVSIFSKIKRQFVTIVLRETGF